MAGTIARHVQRGDHVAVLILTDGVTARHVVAELQVAAARKACCSLGVRDVFFANLPDQRIDGLPLLDVIRPISDVIAQLRPRTVYTHHRGDSNQDHRVAFQATLVAVRPFGDCPVERVLCYEVASSTEWGPPFADWAFLPNVFVDIGPTLDAKLQAVEVYRETYESEVKPFPHPRSPEAVRVYSQQRGLTVGLPAAEAFVLVRALIRESREEGS